MKYIKYNVELNDQIFSIELPKIDWFLGHKLKSNKILNKINKLLES